MMRGWPLTGEWPKPGSRMQPLWRSPEKFNLNRTQSFFTTRKYRFYVLDAFQDWIHTVLESMHQVVGEIILFFGLPHFYIS